jgi:hypothetical protein
MREKGREYVCVCVGARTHVRMHAYAIWYMIMLIILGFFGNTQFKHITAVFLTL